jgi:DNA-binding transcriptional LysR family regulator
MLAREGSSTPYNYTLKLCRDAGFSPMIVGEYPNAEAVIMMVQAGAGVAVLSGMAPLTGVTGVKCVPISDAPYVSADIAINPDNHNPSIGLFLKMAKSFDWG